MALDTSSELMAMLHFGLPEYGLPAPADPLDAAGLSTFLGVYAESEEAAVPSEGADLFALMNFGHVDLVLPYATEPLTEVGLGTYLGLVFPSSPASPTLQYDVTLPLEATAAVQREYALLLEALDRVQWEGLTCIEALIGITQEGIAPLESLSTNEVFLGVLPIEAMRRVSIERLSPLESLIPSEATGLVHLESLAHAIGQDAIPLEARGRVQHDTHLWLEARGRLEVDGIVSFEVLASIAPVEGTLHLEAISLVDVSAPVALERLVSVETLGVCPLEGEVAPALLAFNPQGITVMITVSPKCAIMRS